MLFGGGFVGGSVGVIVGSARSIVITPPSVSTVRSPLTDERALAAYSGRYWEIAEPTAGGKVQPISNQRSHSLFDSVLWTPPDLEARLFDLASQPVEVGMEQRSA